MQRFRGVRQRRSSQSNPATTVRCKYQVSAQLNLPEGEIFYPEIDATACFEHRTAARDARRPIPRRWFDRPVEVYHWASQNRYQGRATYREGLTRLPPVLSIRTILWLQHGLVCCSAFSYSGLILPYDPWGYARQPFLAFKQ